VVTIAVNANPKKSADMQLRQAAVQMAVLGLELNEIDPYCAIERPLVAPKMSPLAMKLTGASYVSAKTKKQFDDALNDGWTIKQATSVPIVVPEPQVKVIEKIIEVEKIVEVERIVYLTADGKVADGSVANGVNIPLAPAASGDLAASIERSVSQFVDHQQQLLNVHEQYMQGPKEYAATFDKVLGAQTTGDLPESLDRTLGMYHEFQSETLRVHEQYLNNQTNNMAAMLSNNTRAPVAKAPVVTSTPAAPVQTAQPAPVTSAPIVHTSAPTVNIPAPAAATAVAMAQVAAPIAQTVIEVAPAVSLDLNKIQTVMMEVVAEKTGYPTEMLALEMDMEADLGIDSIKRVEILGSVQELIPDLPELNPEDLAELRTLGEIVDYMQRKVKSKATSVVPALHLVGSTSDTASNSPTIDLAYIQFQSSH